MSRAFPIKSKVIGLVGVALLFSSSYADAAVVSAPQTTTVKRFTGILAQSGPVSQSPGQPLSPKADWIDFECDYLSLPWKIRIVHKAQGKGQGKTVYLNDPRICDHVEVLMFYYNPQQSFPETGAVDGTAIYVKKIPW